LARRRTTLGRTELETNSSGAAIADQKYFAGAGKQKRCYASVA
jgi:hypothetical protein